MTTRERLEAVKRFVYEEFCKGRKMRSPGPSRTVDDILYVEPRVFIANYPTKPGQGEQPYNVAPSILIMLDDFKARASLEQRFDRYDGTRRPKELGAMLSLQFLCTVYEPALRGDAFLASGHTHDLEEYTAEGFYQLTTWMDEMCATFMGLLSVPGSDLYVHEDTVQMGPHKDQGYLVDWRPLHRGVVTCTFGSYVDRKPNEGLRRVLDD